MATEANTRQVGGTHYKVGGEEHWDRVHRLGLDYFQGQITKYVERWKRKNGVEDLLKARHFLDKYIELARLSEVIAAAADEDTTRPVHPSVMAFGSERNPSGWIGYTFEGATVEGELYCCTHCGFHFYTPPHGNPNDHHACGDATPAYVNQG